jgi:GNAT superfamily N-acetyltransferase
MQYEEMMNRYISRQQQLNTQTELFNVLQLQTKEIIGVSELFPQELDYELLHSLRPDMFSNLQSSTTSGTVYIPKIANLAIQRDYRRQGLATRLVELSIERSLLWGHSHICLFVDDDNLQARQMYKRLGFSEIYLDRTTKKYEMSGIWLKLIPASKLLLVKCI